MFPYITTLLFISVLYSVFKVRGVSFGAAWKTDTQALGPSLVFPGLLEIVRGKVEEGKAVREHADRPKRSISQFLVGSSGLEPPTSRLSGARSNHLSYEPIFSQVETRPLVEMNGFEPMTPCLQSRCSPS